MFKIKDNYKLELQTPETMMLFGSIKKVVGKTKNGENVPSLEVVEVVFIQCNNIVDSQYQQKSEVLYTFTNNTLNFEQSNLEFLKTYNTRFDEIVIIITGQNGRLLEIEDKVSLTLVINKYKMTRYSIEPRTVKLYQRI